MEAKLNGGGEPTLSSYSPSEIQSEKEPDVEKLQNSDVLSAINKLNEHIDEIRTEVNQIKEKSGGWSRAHVVIASLALIIGIMGTLLLVAEWKGDITARVLTIEKQRDTDRQTLDYIRTQGEVNGKSLARIEARVENRK